MIEIGNTTRKLLDYAQQDITPNMQPLRTINALGCSPLAYRTFGGNHQNYKCLDDSVLENAFGGHYLLTMITQAVIVKNILYKDGQSCHTLYCDTPIYRYFQKHGLTDVHLWDSIDFETLDKNITPQNTDHRIYYSSCKPDALLAEGKKAQKNNIPVLFVDTDLILKKRHDFILKNCSQLKAAYGHLEAIGTPCYPDFRKLHFPKGYQLPENLNYNLPAVNTCLMYFSDFDLLQEWASFFKELFINNWLDRELTPTIISQQLLGIDQRTFPMIMDKHGLWNSDKIAPFVDMIWEPPHLKPTNPKDKREWHYYTFEIQENHPEWIQDIMHTWINKKDVENDIRYCNFQSCLMIEVILSLRPDVEKALRSFKSLKNYFKLIDTYGNVDNMLKADIVSNRLTKG